MKRIGLLLSALFTTALAGAQGPVAPAPAVDPNSVAPGELLVEPPTLINLGFEWFMEGDDNRNATVAVSYRRSGESDWKQALPLLRLKGERVYSQSQVDVIAPNMFAGSVLDLEPDTVYDVQFVLADPDGVRGEAAGPLLYARGPSPGVPRRPRLPCLSAWIRGAEDRAVVRRVDVRLQLLVRRYRLGHLGRPRVRPGDTILVHAGTYKYNRSEYTNNASVNRTVPLDGTYYLTADGTAEMPIAIKAAGDGPAIFDGRATSRCSTSAPPTTPISRG